MPFTARTVRVYIRVDSVTPCTVKYTLPPYLVEKCLQFATYNIKQDNRAKRSEPIRRDYNENGKRGGSRQSLHCRPNYASTPVDIQALISGKTACVPVKMCEPCAAVGAGAAYSLPFWFHC